ncbi:hypothetical protein G8A07_02375 [Roseateles sp. DAIF2]|uniref:hypothetical protein n=1 Tax=Roseateles sp. DAIF2 TaxID=2714952 RepID=UPI0018A2E91A|nr:hypothetical protein [Roseateles sp. DAIF2]QPF71886.1 hypothetical protein G8A07_02375 [Roseateles sp. DAIF2]
MKKLVLALASACGIVLPAQAEFNIEYVRGAITATAKYGNYAPIQESEPFNPAWPVNGGLRAVSERFFGLYEQTSTAIGDALSREAAARGASFSGGWLSGPLSLGLSGAGGLQRANLSVGYFGGTFRVKKSKLGGLISGECQALINVQDIRASVAYDPRTLQVVPGASTVAAQPSYGSVTCESNLGFVPFLGGYIERLATREFSAALDQALAQVPHLLLREAVGSVAGGLSKVSAAFSSAARLYPSQAAPLLRDYLANNAAYFLEGRSLSLELNRAPRNNYNPSWGNPLGNDIYRFQAYAFKLDLSDQNTAFTLSLSEETDYRYTWFCNKPVGQECPIDI